MRLPALCMLLSLVLAPLTTATLACHQVICSNATLCSAADSITASDVMCGDLGSLPGKDRCGWLGTPAPAGAGCWKGEWAIWRARDGVVDWNAWDGAAGSVGASQISGCAINKDVDCFAHQRRRVL